MLADCVPGYAGSIRLRLPLLRVETLNSLMPTESTRRVEVFAGLADVVREGNVNNMFGSINLSSTQTLRVLSTNKGIAL